MKEMKELEGEYVKTIDELMHQHHKTIEEKDQEIDYFRKSVQVVLVEKERSGYLNELSKNKNRKKSKKLLKTGESNGEYRTNNNSKHVSLKTAG